MAKDIIKRTCGKGTWTPKEANNVSLSSSVGNWAKSNDIVTLSGNFILDIAFTNGGVLQIDGMPSNLSANINIIAIATCISTGQIMNCRYVNGQIWITNLTGGTIAAGSMFAFSATYSI